MAMPDLKLGSLNIEDIKVSYADEAGALSADVLFKKPLVDFNDINLKGETVNIKRILLDENEAKIAFGKVKEISKASSISDTADVAPMNWKVNIDDLQLSKNRIAYFDANQPR